MRDGKTAILVASVAAIGYALWRVFFHLPKIELEANVDYYLTYIGETALMSEAMADVLDVIGVFYWWDEQNDLWKTVYLSDPLIPGGHYFIVVIEACTLRNFEWWEA